MKLFPLAFMIATTEGFSMLTPRFVDFPRRFGEYLKEFDDIFEPDWPSTFMERQLEQFKDTTSSSAMVFHRASPRYEVIEKPDKFEVLIDVLPEFNPDEIDVGLKCGGRILSISGLHEEKEKGRTVSSQFQQNFSLDPSIQIDKMSADLKGNTLIVSAPRIDRLPESRKIPIHRIEGSHEESSEEEVKESAGEDKQEKKKAVKK